jgi:CDP-diacylglycerol--glycerol-3-phosphate 3-phosphatidyltransferase
MLNRYARAFFTKVFTPLARLLLKLGVSPDVVTLVGTLGVCVGALAFYPRHEFFWGTIVITAFVFSDTLDGIMARPGRGRRHLRRPRALVRR